MNDHPYDGIIETDCDLIFMASHGRKGVAALVYGSETTNVLTHSKIPTSSAVSRDATEEEEAMANRVAR